RFIHTSLKEGCWDHGCTGPSESLKDLTIEKFYEFYRAWCDWEKQPVLKREVVGKRLRAIFPGIKTKRTPREENPRRPTMYLFPSLEECRAAFEKFYKQSPEIWEWS